MTCTAPGCNGLISDGYCNICGLPSTSSSSPTPAPSTPAAQPASGKGSAGSVPQFVVSGPCQMPGCTGRIVDGYCDTCGSPDGALATAQALPSMTGRLGTVALGSARVTGKTPLRARPTASRASQLGAGLTTIPPERLVDPKSALMKNPEVAEDKRFCPHCEKKVGRSTKDTPGRLEGFCPHCRKPFSFTPKLAPGDIVAGQYEVRGCLAHGGMGWIYLAQDRNVSHRWVVLKGLLNIGDEAAMEAAMAEQRFLAHVQHPLIVEIYNFVTHESGAYIVMEYVGGRSIKQILKDRMTANKGVYDPLPVDHALAYMLEAIPALDYLHDRGLLYCDFKPDNLLHLQDSVKLIDLGSVRPIDDDESTIFGTTGYQAPEVPTQGCSIASDIYTVGRTLLICCAEVKGYQSTYATTLPPVLEVPVFAQYDSAYRLIAKACAPNPLDRFVSMDELRYQMLGVLREVVGITRGVAATQSAPSDLFDPPTVVSDVFTWRHLPKLKPSPSDPGVAFLDSLDRGASAHDRYKALASAPDKSTEILLALCMTAIEIGYTKEVKQVVSALLAADPWEWRAVWVEGLEALNSQDWKKAQACFNTVYSQVPGELAPQFALAVACEMGGELDLAEQLYHNCSVTGGGYVAGAAFGLARVRAASRTTAKDNRGVIDALNLVPTTSGGFSQSRQLTASYLTQTASSIADLKKAYRAMESTRLAREDKLAMELDIFSRALRLTKIPKASRKATVETIGDVPVTTTDLRAKISSILQSQATVEHDHTKRTQLIDQANSMRKWSIL